MDQNRLESLRELARCNTDSGQPGRLTASPQLLTALTRLGRLSCGGSFGLHCYHDEARRGLNEIRSVNNPIALDLTY